MPEVTMADAASGVSGLTVVFARRNSNSPASAIAKPALQSMSATRIRHGSANASDGTDAESSHIMTAKSSTSATGGTLSSKACMNDAPCVPYYTTDRERNGESQSN